MPPGRWTVRRRPEASEAGPSVGEAGRKAKLERQGKGIQATKGLVGPNKGFDFYSDEMGTIEGC